jgi:hypothetical protein
MATSMSVRWADHLARRVAPALPRQLAQRRGGRPVDHHHHLVTRVVTLLPRHDPPLVLLQVRGGVPAIHRDVAAAAEGDLVVDHQHFLVVAGAEGDGIVQPELHAGVAEPAAGPVGEEFLAGADRQRRVPDQHADIEVGSLARQLDEDMADFVRIVGAVEAVREQPRARVEAPAQQVDRPLGPDHRLEGGGEIGLGVDQEGRTRRPFPAPTGLAGDEDAHSLPCLGAALAAAPC